MSSLHNELYMSFYSTCYCLMNEEEIRMEHKNKKYLPKKKSIFLHKTIFCKMIDIKGYASVIRYKKKNTERAKQDFQTR